MLDAAILPCYNTYMIIITGATGGIGREIARLLAERGYNLALGYHTQEGEAGKLAAELTSAYGVWALPLKLDLADPLDVAAKISSVIATMGRPEVLINNAAVSLIKPVEETTAEEWQRVIATNLSGAFYACKAVLPSMREGGSILNVSSMWGTLGASCEVAYSAAKAGLEGMSKALSKEYPDLKINVVSLGWVDTPMNAHLSEEDKRDFFAKNPTMHELSATEAAQLIVSVALGEGSGQTYKLGWE